ncbi:Arylesterase precursor [hydrothermal vent metagenome]|uniref:Arylesterase n=1 Tax=hydrothermal vent metagenome TaxID=652676 RepID=A0A3B0TQP6_9ZZZZ
MMFFFAGFWQSAFAQPALAQTFTLVAFGDSLTAGLGVGPRDNFPAQLEARLRKKGYDVTVQNAGVSGDTAAAGLARLDWSIGEDAGAVIVALGSNDALRGLAPAEMEKNLDAILGRLTERGLPVLLAGMLAPPNLGPEYAAEFEPVFARVAKAYGALYYPFFLKGVAADPSLNQNDGMHPNPDGVRVMVANILPLVEALIERAKK